MSNNMANVLEDEHRNCPHCGEHLYMNVRSYANHVRWCDKNPNNVEMRKNMSKKLVDAAAKHRQEENGDIRDYEVKCEKCGKTFIVSEYDKKFPQREHYFCSRKCANSRERSDETKRKISSKLKEFYGSKKGDEDICEFCGSTYIRHKKSQRFCSPLCANRYRSYMEYIKKLDICSGDIDRIKTLSLIYKNQCKFSFSLSEYPEEFDSKIIRKHGWYSAKNRGNNLDGVSRDHMFSVMEGLRLRIDPYLISHPANCKLMTQRKNSSKHKKCSLSYDELVERVESWNNKYGVYKNKIDYEVLKEISIQKYLS